VISFASDDMYAQDSIELLQKSGIDFKRLENEGIDNDVFAEHLVTSGLVLFTNVKWVSFHS
jgi:CCR4-NOT transcription complex subunit 7/8